jgi:Tfp pilus assembly protein PilN
VSCEEKDSAILIEGKTFSFPEVANFMTRLSESSYIKTVDLSGIEQKDASKTFSFVISCKLNAGVELDKASLSDATPKTKTRRGEVE